MAPHGLPSLHSDGWRRVSAYLSVRVLVTCLRARTLTPFGIYCVVVGLGSIVYLNL
jgi:undecaprenyl-diphosphatase